jgi:hypothetical protein
MNSLYLIYQIEQTIILLELSLLKVSFSLLQDLMIVSPKINSLFNLKKMTSKAPSEASANVRRLFFKKKLFTIFFLY